jgi:ribonuclease HII
MVEHERHPVADKSAPTLVWEERLWAEGYRAVAGVDEAGRGALAGPVTAAAVVIPQPGSHAIWAAVRDSKQLAPLMRTRLAATVREAAAAWAVASASAAEIDAMGIAAATRLAMQRAIVALEPAADYLLLDWVRLPAVALPQSAMAKADRRMASVAAASILAKAARDEWMAQLAQRYPDYGFAGHKGYGSAQHLAALARLGPCPEHRHSFAPLARPAPLFGEMLDGASDEVVNGGG